MSRLLDWRGHAWIALVIRLYLGGVFLLACFHKIAHPATFALDVATYQLLPLWAVNFFALVLPWTELLSGVMLIIGLRARAAALLVALMMVSFIIALGWALHLNLHMSCGCFASQAAAAGQDAISWHTLVRDGSWLLLSLYVIVFDRNPVGLDRLFHRRSEEHA